MFDEVKKGVGSILSDIGVKDRNDFTLSIEGVEFPVTSGRVFRSIDNCVDGCSATIALTDTVKETLNPFSYEEAQVYLGGVLVLTGLVYGLEPNISPGGKSLTINIFSSACDIVDSVKYPPYEFKKKKLSQIARELIEEELGLVVEFDSSISDPVFERVNIEAQQTIFKFLNELARQHGILITSNEKGEVLFTQANTSSKPVETIENITDVSAKYNGRELFAIYRATAQSPARGKKTKKVRVPTNKGSKTIKVLKFAEAYDPVVPISRRTIFSADNTEIDKLDESANWQRSKRWVDALSMKIPRVGWRPQGKTDLYKENTLITIKNDDLWIGTGFDLLIRSVEYQIQGKSATSALTLVPPQAYTGEEIPDIFGLGGGPLNPLKSIGVDL
jgi:prophage tail gpP-like protein